MKKILVIDDDPDIVELVKMRLAESGYNVVTAGNGKDGLDKVARENPDLIVLDVLMPSMDGYTFIKELKASQRAKSIPIIILTAKEKMKDLFEMEGVKHYMVKPFDSKELLVKIKQCLG